MRASSKSRAEAKGSAPRSSSAAISDRLRATEEALRAAQATIAQQEKREKELRALLVTNGVAREATETGSNPIINAKMQALKSIHEQKVRALMKSINQLQEQLQALRAQDKEHRRSALIQTLRKSVREHELVIDVLKQTLADKVPEFRDSRALVNDFVIQKSVGGPLRFRPKTREELENDLDALNEKHKQALGSLRTAQRKVAAAAAVAADVEAGGHKSTGAESDADGAFPEDAGDNSAPPQDPALVEEVERLQVELSAKSITIHSQADEIRSLHAEIDELRVVSDKLERKKHRVELLEDKLASEQLEAVRLVHAQAALAEQCEQLREELQFLRDTHVDDVSSRDEERLAQLELAQRLQARELELERQLEDQQRKWAADRTAVHQQMRLLEKEKQLALDTAARAEAECAALVKKNDALERQHRALQEALEHADTETRSLASNVEELENVLAQHDALSRDERDALSKRSTETLRQLEQSVADKDALVKSTERQLTAAKLLVRQSKKEKEQMHERVLKLQDELRAVAGVGCASTGTGTGGD